MLRKLLLIGGVVLILLIAGVGLYVYTAVPPLPPGTNAIIDQAIHTENMSRDEAMRFMIEETFQEEREAAGKWVRAQLTSAQLATYFVGYLEHVDLRRETQAAWGDDFQLKKYHDQVLSFGSPPVAFVRALLLGKDIP